MNGDDLMDDWNRRHKAGHPRIWVHVWSPCAQAWADGERYRYVVCHISGGFFGRRQGLDLRLLAECFHPAKEREALIPAAIERFDKIVCHLPGLEGVPPAPRPSRKPRAGEAVAGAGGPESGVRGPARGVG